MNTVAAPVSVGDVIGGRYRIEALLGHGGMAIVFQARHTATGKLCALKLVHAHLVSRKELIDLFVREAQLGARIGANPYIVDVFDGGADEARKVPFLVMELLTGETLEDYLDNRGAMPPALVRVVVEHLADALDQAHRAGVIHRDLKPSNLFLTSDRKGQPILKVMDFGIAKILEAEIQRTATQVGTPAYAAPEQMGPTLRRLAGKQGVTIAAGVGPSTDVWAMGLVVFELFTGLPTGHYWGVETLAELPTKVALEEAEPASLRAGDRSGLLPPGFDGWLARCLRKNAAERWPTAGEAAAELFRLMTGGVLAGATTPSYGPPGDVRGAAQGARPTGAPFGSSPPVAAGTPAGTAVGGSWPGGPQATPSTGPVGSWQAGAFSPPGQAYGGATSSGMAHGSTVLSAPTPAPSGHAASYPPVPAPQGASYPSAPPGYPPAGYGPQLTPPGSPGNAPLVSARTVPSAPGRKKQPVLVAAVIGFSALALAGSLWGYGRYQDGALQRRCEERGQRCEESCARGNGSSCVRLGAALESAKGAAGEADKAAPYYEKACSIGEMRGCAKLGVHFYRGPGGLPRDAAEAKRLFEKACSGDDALGCAKLGQMVEKGEGGASRAEPRAIELYTKACDGGELSGCRDLGRMQEAGRGGLAKDDQKAAAMFKRACDGGEMAGCNDLGLLVSAGRGGQPKDEARASELYRKACEGGYAASCSNLGLMIETGRGVLRDEARAVALYKKACDEGELLGCDNLARMYENGSGGLPKDEARAAEIFKRACDGGDLIGCNNYGAMCEDGRGVVRDEGRAAALFKQACDGGTADGCRNLGDLYRSGRGVPRDETRAVALLRLACDKSDMYACSMLGWFYENGRGGMARDEGRALELYKHSCDENDGLGCTNYGAFAEVGRAGLTADENLAATAYRKGCDLGHSLSCSGLGWLVFQGKGGQPRDRNRAIELLRRGCKGGDQTGCDRLRSLRVAGE